MLMRAFLMLYSTDFVDGRRRNMVGKSRSSERRAYVVLSSVSYSWWNTLKGWPESPTRKWVRHQLKKLVECECTFTITQTHIAILSVWVEHVRNYWRNLMNYCGLFSTKQGKFDWSLSFKWFSTWYMLSKNNTWFLIKTTNQFVCKLNKTQWNAPRKVSYRV